MRLPAALIAVLLFTLVPRGACRADDAPAVNYIAADAIYLNVGRRAGVTVGAHIRLTRNGVLVAVLEAVYVSSHSSSCRIIEPHGEILVGDRATFTPEIVPTPQPATVAPAVPRAPSPRTLSSQDRKHVSGYVAMQLMWQRDLDGGSSSLQPAISMRVVADDFAGTGGRFRLRHRSRYYHRAASGNVSSSDYWTHQLTELMVSFGDRASGLTWGAGRTIVDDLTGLGTIDGAYVSMRTSPHVRFGLAGGTQPSFSGAPETSRQKVGTFVTWEAGDYATRRAAFTLALSGSYVEGNASREFCYQQGVFSASNRFNLYESVEIDLNRNGYVEANGGRLSFSNALISAVATPASFAAVDVSYDTRRTLRDHDTFSTPDSLFDGSSYSGYRAGVTLTPTSRLYTRVDGGVRLRDGSDETNRHYSVLLSARQFPLSGHTLSARWMVSETPFVTGYRPSLTWRFPAARGLRAEVGAGATAYDQAPLPQSRSYFVETGAYYSPPGRMYYSFNYREYFGAGLDAVQLYAESGINF